MIATTPADLSSNPATAACAACTVVDTTKANSTSYTPPSALAAGMYFWQVQAIEPTSSTGLAAWSEIFSFTTTGATLAAPTLTSPSAGATGVSLPPAFNWTSVQGNNGYRILISATESVLPTSPAVGTCGGCSIGATTSGTSYTPSSTSLVGGTTYYWEVQALAPAGQNGAWSAIASFTAVAGDFSLSVSPTSLTIPPGASGTSTLTLTPVNNIATSSITFTCSTGTLTGVTCLVGALGSNDKATVTVTASTSARGYPAQPRTPQFRGPWLVLMACLGLTLTALFGRRRHLYPQACVVRYAILAAALAILLGACLSCGGGSGGGSSPQGQSGTITVTGATTSTSHSAQISVTIS